MIPSEIDDLRFALIKAYAERDALRAQLDEQLEAIAPAFQMANKAADLELEMGELKLKIAALRMALIKVIGKRWSGGIEVNALDEFIHAAKAVCEGKV